MISICTKDQHFLRLPQASQLSFMPFQAWQLANKPKYQSSLAYLSTLLIFSSLFDVEAYWDLSTELFIVCRVKALAALYQIPLVTEGMDSLCSVDPLVPSLCCSLFCFWNFWNYSQTFINTQYFFIF